MPTFLDEKQYSSFFKFFKNGYEEFHYKKVKSFAKELPIIGKLPVEKRCNQYILMLQGHGGIDESTLFNDEKEGATMESIAKKLIEIVPEDAKIVSLYINACYSAVNCIDIHLIESLLGLNFLERIKKNSGSFYVTSYAAPTSIFAVKRDKDLEYDMCVIFDQEFWTFKISKREYSDLFKIISIPLFFERQKKIKK